MLQILQQMRRNRMKRVKGTADEKRLKRHITLKKKMVKIQLWYLRMVTWC